MAYNYEVKARLSCFEGYLQSNIYNQPRELIEERKNRYAEASSLAKAHYKATKKGKLQGKEYENSRREAFGNMQAV